MLKPLYYQKREELPQFIHLRTEDRLHKLRFGVWFQRYKGAGIRLELCARFQLKYWILVFMWKKDL